MSLYIEKYYAFIRKMTSNFLVHICTQHMMPCSQRNIRISKPVKLSELPFDSISEILSWLPVECLLRFKGMCKQWCSLIKDYKFVLKHMERTSPMLLLYPCKSNDANFEFVSSSAGLCMEKSVSNSRVFRIRNPATHQVLYLPDVPPYTTTVDFAFNSFTGECKVLCVYWDKIRRNVDAKFGFKVLTIGNDEHWRLLEIPDQNKLRNKSVLQGCSTAVDKVEGVCHLLQTIRVTDNEEDLYMEIHSLDLWSECFITSTLHRGDFSDFNDVQFLLWNNCLTVGYATETSLEYFLVLEEYKERN